MMRAAFHPLSVVAMRNYFQKWRPKGHCPPRKPLKKILWSGLGAFVGILLIAGLEQLLRVDERWNLFLIASFGASAVLIYGAPQAEFSQPRNLIGGHVLSALVGVSVALALPAYPVLACALAVSLAIMLMHFSRTMHPPGGATALIAVIGGDSIRTLGYGFVVTPVLSGALILLLIALLVNNLSRNSQRHYPVYWLR